MLSAINHQNSAAWPQYDTNSKQSAAAGEAPLSLNKAIKAYQDERLTGLTDEEREEIERRAKEYLKKNPIRTEQDREVYNQYVKSLLKKFGFKGDMDEYSVSVGDEMQGKSDDSIEQREKMTITEQYQRSALGATGVKNHLFGFDRC